MIKLNEQFSDDSYSLEPEIENLEPISDKELKYLEKHTRSSISICELMHKKKKKPRRCIYQKYLENDELDERDDIDLKIVSALKYYNRQNFKETRLKNVYCNIYGDYYRLKNNSKVRVSYLKNNLGYPTISIFGKIYDARNLMFETFICSTKNIKLFYKKGNKNEIQNISYKFKY